MATSRAFKTLLSEARHLRNDAHRFLALLVAMRQMIANEGGGDPEDRTDEELVDELTAMIADLKDFDLA